jgi:hypothetical protein
MCLLPWLKPFDTTFFPDMITQPCLNGWSACSAQDIASSIASHKRIVIVVKYFC